MKSKTIVFAAILVAAVMALFVPRQASASVNFSYFYENLVPYGDWVDVEQYGYCWVPRGMAPDWRPYTDGYWTYTDAGWTWVSYEDFGSITYHYGRWVRLDDVGWVWKPDNRWGPAWVSWRQSDSHIGWAPLPPDVAFDENAGVGVWVDRDYDIGPSAYVFCETRYFGAPVIRNVIVPVRRNVEILNVSVNITNITVITGREYGRVVYCGGPDYRWVSARCERPIDRLDLVLRRDGDWTYRGRPELSRHVGVQLFVNAPVIEPPHDRHFAPPHVVREIRAPRVDRGWGIVADPGERERIHQRYQDQTRGLTRQTAPAYRVNETEVHNFVREGRPSPSGQPGGKPMPPQPGQQQPQRPMNAPSVAPSAQPQRPMPSQTAPTAQSQRPMTPQTAPSAQPQRPMTPQTAPTAQPQRPMTPQTAPTAQPQRPMPSQTAPTAQPQRPMAPQTAPTAQPQRVQPSRPEAPASTPQAAPAQPQRQRTPSEFQPRRQERPAESDRTPRVQEPQRSQPSVQRPNFDTQRSQPVQREVQQPRETQERNRPRQEQRQPEVQQQRIQPQQQQQQQQGNASRDREHKKRDRNDPNTPE